MSVLGSSAAAVLAVIGRGDEATAPECLVCGNATEADDPLFHGLPVHYECAFSIPLEELRAIARAHPSWPAADPHPAELDSDPSEWRPDGR